MKDSETREAILLKEIESLKEAHSKRDYLRVIMLSPQIIVEIIDTLASYDDEWIERKITSNYSDNDREVYKLAGQLQKKESDRSYIVASLVGYYDSGCWDKSNDKDMFVKFFTKLDDLISLRNIYAHEFYVKNVTDRRAKNCSKSGLEIAELFSQQFEV